MKNLKNGLILFAIVTGCVYFYFQKKQPKQVAESLQEESVKIEKLNKNSADQFKVSSEALQNTHSLNSESTIELANRQKKMTLPTSSEQTGSLQSYESIESNQLLTYIIDDGLAVVQGDIVIGKISPDAILTSFSGSTKEPLIKLWTTTEIPYYIQPNLRNPDRVIQALTYFSNTNIRFVPYANQEDVIVFEQGQGTCKSYLGRIGGRQPLWISEACSPREIAHEIMHSLGFIHEQNRDDRDNYINVFWENINPKFKINFEKFSSASMKVTGLSQFDFESIMIYPELMFSTNGLPTIRSKIDEQVVFPAQTLTSKDIERVNKAYVK